MERESLRQGIELFTDEGSVAVVQALSHIAWNPNLTASSSPLWETEVRTILTDPQLGRDYFVSSDSRYLEADINGIDDIPQLTHGSGDRAITPLLRIEKILPGRSSPSEEARPFVLYPHNYYAEGPRVMVLYGPDFRGGAELGTES